MSEKIKKNAVALVPKPPPINPHSRLTEELNGGIMGSKTSPEAKFSPLRRGQRFVMNSPATDKLLAQLSDIK